MKNDNEWNSYQKDTAQNPPSKTAEFALQLFDEKRGLMVDLGCGAGVDSIHFLERGWRVLAVDAETDYFEGVRKFMPQEKKQRLNVQKMMFEELELPEADCINASFSLPFCTPEKFEKMWKVIRESIREGGRFSGTFFGNRDEWKTEFADTRTFHSKEEIEQLFSGFQMEMLEEEEFDGRCYGENGEPVPKHWHIFYVVARKEAL